MLNSAMAQNGKTTLEQRVAANLRALREHRSLTQPEAAKGIGVGMRTLCTWEAGDRLPSGRNLGKLVTFYKVTSDEIFK